MESKIIEQENNYSIKVVYGSDNIYVWQEDECVDFNKCSRTTVAKAIDPKYQEMEEALRKLTDSKLFENIIHLNARAGGKQELADAWKNAIELLQTYETKIINQALQQSKKKDNGK